MMCTWVSQSGVQGLSTLWDPLGVSKLWGTGSGVELQAHQSNGNHKVASWILGSPRVSVKLSLSKTLNLIAPGVQVVACMANCNPDSGPRLL